MINTANKKSKYYFDSRSEISGVKTAQNVCIRVFSYSQYTILVKHLCIKNRNTNTRTFLCLGPKGNSSQLLLRHFSVCTSGIFKRVPYVCGVHGNAFLRQKWSKTLNSNRNPNPRTRDCNAIQYAKQKPVCITIDIFS